MLSQVSRAADVANALIGRPYVPLGRAADGLDCYGVVLAAHWLMGAPVPFDPLAAPGSPTATAQLVRQETDRREWVETAPCDLAMAITRNGAHVGVVLAGRIIHAERAHGVHSVPLFHRLFSKARFVLWQPPKSSMS